MPSGLTKVHISKGSLIAWLQKMTFEIYFTYIFGMLSEAGLVFFSIFLSHQNTGVAEVHLLIRRVCDLLSNVVVYTNIFSFGILQNDRFDVRTAI